MRGGACFLVRTSSVTLSVTLKGCKHRNIREFAATSVNTVLDRFVILQHTYQQRTTKGDNEATAFVTFTR